MKLYQTVDGTLIGFYKERGGEVQALMYRDVYETRTVTQYREQRIWVPSTEVTIQRYIPGFYDTRQIEIPGRWEDRAIRVPAYDEQQLVETPGYYERVHVQEPGGYEIKPVWFDDYYITKYYWREAHPARGLEAAWIPYQELVPAGYSDTRVWVEGEWRTKVVWVDATWEYQTVTVPEAWGTETIWVLPISRIERYYVTAKRIPFTTGERGHYETTKVPYSLTEKVWVGYEPVYEMIDQSQVTLYEVLELHEGAGPGPTFEDVITIRNRLTGEELATTARYVGYGTRIAENEFVVP